MVSRSSPRGVLFCCKVGACGVCCVFVFFVSPPFVLISAFPVSFAGVVDVGGLPVVALLRCVALVIVDGALRRLGAA